MSLNVAGLQKAQQGMMKTMATLKPGGPFESAIRFATLEALRYAIAITHVDTGALRASHRMKMDRDSEGPKGVIFIQPGVLRPTGGSARRAQPSIYGFFENARGGEHAFYGRVPNERGGQIARQATNAYLRSLNSANT